MKRWRFHRAALAEVEGTARWYERERAGLGDEFVVALDDVLARLERGEIATSPVPEDPRARRVFLQRFPHAVVFVDSGEECFVLAVAHLRRSPGYWVERMDAPDT